MASNQKSTPVSSATTAVFLVVFYAAAVALGLSRVFSVPTPLPHDAPAHEFSEARALQHVSYLCETIGHRQVSTPGLQAANQYLLREGRKLVRLAEGRPDLTVTVEAEDVSGAVNMEFMGHKLTNAYRRLTNVILIIAPTAVAHRRGILVSAHQDSPISSVGASDDASNVALMLEMARAIIAGNVTLHTPLIMVFTGGEESISQAAHGFASQSKHVDRVAAFINLESIGPGGVPIVFQHSGAWTVQQFARGATTPRGTIIAQDVFEAGLVPGDSDYRMFSYRHYGKWPGIDIAYIMDGAVYHTELDTLQRMRPGAVQEMGQSVMGGVLAMSEHLGRVYEEDEKDAAAGIQGGRVARLLHPAPEHDKAVFFDLGAWAMVTYPISSAQLYHTLPLALVVTLPIALQMLLGGGGGAGAGRSGLPPLGAAYRAMLTGLLRTAASMVLCLLLPAGFGAVRVLLSGKPMVWFAHQWVAFVTYLPIGCLAMLLPWLDLDINDPRHRPYLGHYMWGAALLNSLVAAAIAAAGFGMAFIFAMWGIFGAAAGAIVAAGCANGQPLTWRRLTAVLALCAAPVTMAALVLLSFVFIMIQRMSLTGHVSVVLADVLIGVLAGLTTLGCSGGCLLPIIVHALGKRAGRVCAAVLTVVVIIAAVASVMLQPYSADMPKRVLINHLHITNATAAQARAAAPDGSKPPTPPAPVSELVAARWAFAGTDSVPLASVLTHMDLGPPANAPVLDGLCHDFAVAFPLDSLLETVVFEAQPGSAPLVDAVPHVRLLSEHQFLNGSRSLQLELYTQLPCWGVINITGPLLGWSITPQLHADTNKWGSVQHIVRFTEEDGEHHWPLWLLANGTGEELRVALSIAYLNQTEPLKDMRQRLPAWATTSLQGTTYQSVWRF